MLRAEIAKGLVEHLNTVSFPVGDIEIRSKTATELWGEQPEKKIYSYSWLTELTVMRFRGFVTFNEPKGFEDELARAGVKTLRVSPTELAKQNRDEKRSSNDFFYVPVASCEVLKIIQSSPYVSPELSQSEEHRLVLGTYRLTALSWYRALAPKGFDGEYKFRAVLQLNPFTKQYVFKFADWGSLDSDGWMTKNVK